MAIEIGPGWTIGGGITVSTPPPSEATAGWYAGGNQFPTIYSTIDRIIFATDTATASVRGPLSSGRYGFSGSGTVNNGWFFGGQTTTVVSTVDRITYATDTATASVRGPLNVGYSLLTASTDNSTYGWFGGGYTPAGSRSTVQRITYATDTATASVRGTLTQNNYTLEATSGVQ